MTSTSLCLVGTLRQSDAAHLKDQVLEQLASGALRIDANGLDDIDYGPMQVLLCAAVAARAQGLDCQLDQAAIPAIDRRLAAMRLPDAATYFTLFSSTEVSDQT